MLQMPQGYDARLLAEVDSTNAEAARVAGTLGAPTWIMAGRQTQGKGRRGRPWTDPAGNFAATLVYRPSGDLQARALRSFVAALALHDALAELTGTGAGLALKWPNDVLMNGGKVAGILLESLGGPEGHLAVGIGVNLITAPQPEALEARAVAPVCVLGETGQRVAQKPMLEALADSYARYEAQMTDFGFAAIRTAWLARAARLGEEITARTGQHMQTGIFETVDDAGQLVLKTANGRACIAAADVFFQGA